MFIVFSKRAKRLEKIYTESSPCASHSMPSWSNMTLVYDDKLFTVVKKGTNCGSDCYTCFVGGVLADRGLYKRVADVANRHAAQ